MALSDLISRPITAPLEGFDKAVGVGFELAQQQERIRIAQEQLDLRQEEIKSNYLSKGIEALSSVKSVTGPAKNALLDVAYSYFVKGGFKNLDPTKWKIVSSEDTIDTFVAIEKDAQEKYPNNPKLQNAYIAQKVQQDPEQWYKTASEYRIKEAQVSSEIQKQLSIEAAKEEFKKRPKSVIERVNQIRTEALKGLPEVQKKPQLFREFLKTLQGAESVSSTDPDKAEQMINQAEQMFGELKGAYKPKELEVKKEKLKPLSDKQIESLTTFQEIPRLINDIKVSIKKNKSYFGGIRGRAIRFGESIGIQTDVGSTLDQLLSDVKQTVGKLKEGGVLRLEDEKKYERILPSIKDKPEVALNKADLILRDMSSKVKTFVATMKKAGRDVSQFESEINAISVPELPKTISGKEPTPQPSGPKQAEIAPAKKGVIPLSKLQERAKIRKKTIDAMIQDATNQGYEIDRSR